MKSITNPDHVIVWWKQIVIFCSRFQLEDKIRSNISLLSTGGITGTFTCQAHRQPLSCPLTSCVLWVYMEMFKSEIPFKKQNQYLGSICKWAVSAGWDWIKSQRRATLACKLKSSPSDSHGFHFNLLLESCPDFPLQTVTCKLNKPLPSHVAFYQGILLPEKYIGTIYTKQLCILLL